MNGDTVPACLASELNERSPILPSLNCFWVSTAFETGGEELLHVKFSSNADSD